MDIVTFRSHKLNILGIVINLRRFAEQARNFTDQMKSMNLFMKHSGHEQQDYELGIGDWKRWRTCTWKAFSNVPIESLIWESTMRVRASFRKVTKIGV